MEENKQYTEEELQRILNHPNLKILEGLGAPANGYTFRSIFKKEDSTKHTEGTQPRPVNDPQGKYNFFEGGFGNID
jgi:hypothetical protein